MNNSNQKNVHYSLSACNLMPHPDAVDVAVFADGFKSSSVNNQLQKLLDNDVWTQNRIKEMQSKAFGPKKYDKDAMDGAPEGYKAYDADAVGDGIAVLRKVDVPPADTLEEVWPGRVVRHMYNYGNTLFVCTDAGVYYTRDGETYQQICVGGDCEPEDVPEGEDEGEGDGGDEEDLDVPATPYAAYDGSGTAGASDGEDGSQEDEPPDEEPEDEEPEDEYGAFDVYAAGGFAFAAMDDGIY